MMSLGAGLRGLATALATSVIVLGALSLSLAEGMVISVPTSLPEPTLPPVNLTPLANPSPTQTSAAPTATTAVLVTPTHNSAATCRRPSGWETYTIQPGDTLEALASERNIQVEQLMAGNCLVSPQVLDGTYLYLPVVTPSATVTRTVTATKTAAVTAMTSFPTKFVPGVVYPSPVPCGPFQGWVRYRVQRGDTLFTLSRILNVSVSELQHANCLGSSTLIRAGDWLWVPRIPVRPATATNTPNQPTTKPTGTNTPVPSSTITSEPTETTTATPTDTATATETTAPSPTVDLTEPPADMPTLTATTGTQP